MEPLLFFPGNFVFCGSDFIHPFFFAMAVLRWVFQKELFCRGWVFLWPWTRTRCSPLSTLIPLSLHLSKGRYFLFPLIAGSLYGLLCVASTARMRFDMGMWFSILFPYFPSLGL